MKIRELYRSAVVGDGEVGCGEIGDETVFLIADDQVKRDLGGIALEIR
jgi:hypothetical protein